MSGISPSNHAGEHLLWAPEYCANCLPRRERRKKKRKRRQEGFGEKNNIRTQKKQCKTDRWKQGVDGRTQRHEVTESTD